MSIPRSVSFAAVLLLAGCATLSESQCKTASWRDLGARDAYDGQERGFIDAHRSACAGYGIAPDATAYALGFEEGLRRLCTARRGYSFAVEGKLYRHTCPAEIEANFQSGFRLGSDLRLEANRVNALQNDIRNSEELFRRSQDNNERVRLRRQIQTLEEQSREAQRRWHRLEDEAARLGYR